MRLIIELIAAAVLVVALAVALTGWHSEHARLRKEAKKSPDVPQALLDAQAATASLMQQHAQDVAAIQQLRHDLDQANTQVKNLTATSTKATLTATDRQKDFTALSAQFDDMRERETKASLGESQYFQMYTQLSQSAIDQQEYIKGLYLDDSTFRTAAKEPPYTAIVSLTAPPSLFPPEHKKKKAGGNAAAAELKSAAP